MKLSKRKMKSNHRPEKGVPWAVRNLQVALQYTQFVSSPMEKSAGKERSNNKGIFNVKRISV